MDLYGKIITLENQRFFLCLPTKFSKKTKHNSCCCEKGEQAIWARLEEHPLLLRDNRLHCNEQIWFWFQEHGRANKAGEYSKYFAGGSLGPTTHTAYTKSIRGFIGWRPVLIPLTDDDQFDWHVLSGIPYGTSVRMYTLMMGLDPVCTCADTPPTYVPDLRLSITDTLFSPQNFIPWIICDGMAIAERILIKRISWLDLSGMGLFSDSRKILIP